VVANAFGSAVSREALLSPAPPAGETPAVTGQPDDRFALAGEAVTFSASASGTAPLFYQWQRNGASIPGATDPSLTLAPVAPGDLGARFRVVVANAFGSAVSREALLVGPSAYVQALYADILGRPADRGGLALFSLLLARGTTPEQVATQLISVPERAELEAVRTYQVVLGRAPSRAEIDGWVSSRAGGRSVTDLQATLLAGPEYLARQGGRPRGFLRGLYRDVLGRAPRRRELLVQMMRVRRAGREAAARGVLTSVEAWNRVAAGLSVALLGRAPRPAELAAWVGQLRAGLPRERLEVMLLSGPEYLARS
jgi:hypothetical protein